MFTTPFPVANPDASRSFSFKFEPQPGQATLYHSEGCRAPTLWSITRNVMQASCGDPSVAQRRWTSCLPGKHILESPEVKNKPGTSLAVQWWGLCAPTAVGPGSVPGWGTKIPQTTRRGAPPPEKKKQKNKLVSKNPKCLLAYRTVSGIHERYRADRCGLMEK